jgi:hypothetical protein
MVESTRPARLAGSSAMVFNERSLGVSGYHNGQAAARNGARRTRLDQDVGLSE